MPDINDIARARRVAFRNLKRSLKSVDTAVEVLERFLDRKLSLKRSIISQEDLISVLDQTRQIDKNLDSHIKEIKNTEIAFKF